MNQISQPEALAQLIKETEAANAVTQGRRQLEKTAPIPMLVDPRRAQLIALFDLSDVRGQDLLIAIAGIHAARYPKERK